jgi:hypothetical protein
MGLIIPILCVLAAIIMIGLTIYFLTNPPEEP